MTILVTGAGGQLGSELAARLGRRATAYDRDLLDITEAIEVVMLLDHEDEDDSIEAVVNCAAYTHVDAAETSAEQCFRVNADAVETLARTCAARDIPLVQISTDYVFGGDRGRTLPYIETDPPAPVNVYGESKLAGERYAATCPKHLIVRTCGLYAAPRAFQQVTNFPQTMLRLALERDVVRVVADQVCSPTYVPHLAASVLFLLECEAWGTYHLVDRGAVSWYELAVELFRQAGVKTRIEAITTGQYLAEKRSASAAPWRKVASHFRTPSAAIAPRPNYSVLDTTKYARLGGPELPMWQEGIAAYLAALGQNADDD